MGYPPTLPSTAARAYHDGNYVLAANLAEAAGSAEALAFAARARNADAVTREKGLCLTCLEKAEATARAAILAGTAQRGSFGTSDYLLHKPALAQAYVQLAIAIGLRGRLLDASEAQAEGLAEKGRAAIDRALELDPQNDWARASLGGWHLEIVRRAGPVLASVMYGASEREGLESLRAALASDPSNLLLAHHFALTLLALDVARYRSEASKALLSGLADTTDDALTAFTRKRADQLLELLKAGEPEDIEALVRKYQGYPP
jgi:tetratricopeptide (TPR) repeat protein